MAILTRVHAHVIMLSAFPNLFGHTPSSFDQLQNCVLTKYTAATKYIVYYVQYYVSMPAQVTAIVQPFRRPEDNLLSLANQARSNV